MSQREPARGSPRRSREPDVAVVGAGAAGMYVALRAAEAGAQVVLVSRKRLREAVRESASFWAQGGLAAALAAGDSPERHAQDTIEAGRGLCRAAAVEALVHEAPGAVEELITRGVGLRHRPRWETGAGAGGRPQRPAHRPRGRQRDGQGAHRPADRARARPARASRCASGPRWWHCGATASAAPG